MRSSSALASKHGTLGGPRICIAGAGAIGIALAVRLALAGQDVNLLARGRGLETIRRKGISLIGTNGAEHATVISGAVDELQPADIIFLCVKSHDLASLGESIQPLMTAETIVVPLVNGIPFWYFQGRSDRFDGRIVNAVDRAGQLNNLFPADQLIGAVTMILAERAESGVSRCLNPMRLTIGEVDDVIKPRLGALAEILVSAGISTIISPKIRDPLWTKVIANLMVNPLSVVCHATLEDMFGNAALVDITRKIFAEGLLAAASHGARVETDFLGLASVAKAMGAFKTSMLQDFENGRALEIAAICESAFELGELYGVAMPFSRDISNLALYKSAASLLRAGAER